MAGLQVVNWGPSCLEGLWLPYIPGYFGDLGGARTLPLPV